MKTLQKSIKNFNKRWKIPYDEKAEFERFRNRVLLSFDAHIGYELSNTELGTHYIRLLGLPSTSSRKGAARYQSEVLKRPTLSNLATLTTSLGGGTLPVQFQDTEIRKYINTVDDLPELIRCVRCVFWLEHYVTQDEKEDWDNRTELFFESICDDLNASQMSVNVNRAYDVMFYPKGAGLLDEKLVDDILDWLPAYPRKTQQYFESALSEYLNKHYRDSIDQMRLSLEVFLKHLLNNRKSLEKQTDFLGKHLKDKNVPAHIANTYSTILNQYSQYQNEFAKHDDHRKPRQITEDEAEFIVYETGLLMRFLIQLDHQSQNS